MHYFGHIGAGTALVDDRQGAAKTLGKGPGPLGTPSVGGDHDGIAVGETLFQVLQHDGCGIEIVDRDIEEPLDLSGMEVDGYHPVGAGTGVRCASSSV